MITSRAFLAAIFGAAHAFTGFLPPIPGAPGSQQPLQPFPEHEFSLRHIFHHGTHKYPDLHRRQDITDQASVLMLNGFDGPGQRPPILRARSQSHKIQRLADRSQGNIDYLLDTGRSRGQPVALDASAWTVDDVHGPNITDKETVLSLARMAANAYVLDDQDSEWYDVGHGFNYTTDFGWKNDGLRGHIFADTENQTVVIAIKGTSPAVFDGSGTTTNDKINDNLFFSCCCGQGGRYGWLQVCNCQTSAYRCNSICVVDALRNKNRYYYAAQEIYRNVTKIYPEADIWLVGHSLGGSTNSLVALTYGLPAVTFEAPGEAMPAKRLGLPTPPGYSIGAHQQRPSTGGFHFGHTADPIFMGSCNAYSSVCTIAGYAMESICHTGETCTYDTVGDLGWRVGAGTHKISSVIKDVILKYDTPANCTPMVDCTDCYNWEFYDSNHTESTTTSKHKTTTSKATRTSTCKTPGWWGCLDGTTTTTTDSTTTSTTTKKKKTTTTTTDIATTTCLTPGWFGCKDKSTDEDITATVPVSSPISTAPVTTTCHTPGYFGCKDAKTSSTQPAQTITPPPQTVTSTQATATSTSQPANCTSRNWYGKCTDWRDEDEVKWDL